MNTFEAFDPLKAKSTAETDVAALAQKREIKNILSSYVGWYDPFCELIQNSLDSLELRLSKDEKNYIPTIWITVDIKDNSLTVTDYGVGLNEAEFKQFLCPDISFKSGNTRGHKGVGATYLAYGFNFIQVATKCNGYEAIGKMENARTWLSDANPSGNPQVKPDNNEAKDLKFQTIDNGVSIYLKFDKTTHPKELKWIVTDKAESWHKILSVKTGIGAFSKNYKIQIDLTIIDKHGNQTSYNETGVGYYLPHLAVRKSATIQEINDKRLELFKKHGEDFNLPGKYKNLDAIYQTWNSEDLLNLEKNGTLKFTEEEKEIINLHKPSIYVSYVYSVKVWDVINSDLGIRNGVSILYGGIQIAANNMPQGETIQIPLNRNIGRQNQIHVLIHFENCTPDLGRKGFQSDLIDFAKEVSKKISDGPLLKLKRSLRVNTGNVPNLKRQTKIEEWKLEMVEHENSNPLQIINENFFLPARSISITSLPTREQDVIAFFNQLLAGGVIRGVRVMSTNERSTYDGLVRVVIDPPENHHIYDKNTNPLGVEESVVKDFELPFKSPPMILEYKYSLDGLIEDIENGNKNSNDIGIVVCWETGEDYKHNYHITSLLDPDNLNQREYHGITHIMTNLNTNQKEMDLIVLSELTDFLNDPENTIQEQIEKYDS